MGSENAERGGMLGAGGGTFLQKPPQSTHTHAVAGQRFVFLLFLLKIAFLSEQYLARKPAPCALSLYNLLLLFFPILVFFLN